MSTNLLSKLLRISWWRFDILQNPHIS